MIKLLRLAGLGFAGLVLVGWSAEPAASAAPCTGNVQTLDNQTVDRYMTVPPGKSCSVILYSPTGPTFGAVIVQQPKHGKAMARGNSIAYLAPKNYVGPDNFVYARKGVDALNRPSTTTVRVTVTVTP
jgi:hypothetical protein